MLDRIDVPYRCTKLYDDGPFLSYPERHGWEVLQSPTGVRVLLSGAKPTNRDLESFLQTWLYFGLLNDFQNNKALHLTESYLNGVQAVIGTSTKFNGVSYFRGSKHAIIYKKQRTAGL
jgi:hypothetical protein